MIRLILAGALLLGAHPAVAQSQTQQTPQPPVQTDPSVAVEGIEVVGRPLEQMVTDFIAEVEAPSRGRGVARWDRTVCVGVVNLRGEAAQFIVDRVSTLATDLGLRTGAPGCRPNIVILAAADGRAMARTLVEEQPRAFRIGRESTDRGPTALREFQNAEAPVRWWSLSMPTDADTGARAIFVPGECINPCGQPADFAPSVHVFAASRLRTEVVDNLFRTIVIFDVDDTADITILQLADYIAMVTLAQVNPDAETRAFHSILNVFEDPTASLSLTDWDIAYLEGLYETERSANGRGARRQLMESVRDANERQREGTPEENQDSDDQAAGD